MNSLEKVRKEIASLRRQSSVDFEFTALALKDTGNRVQAIGEQAREIGERVDALGREVKAGFDQLAGRMRLQESRLSAVLQAVDHSMELCQPTAERISDLEERVSALERARDSAA
ncbi:MAG: hypothetical protein KF760_08590 [Candidatus Eremiobacteraeota bacterium]|nr:hypothetical protein [Candidatus Eremiobacteraeota bacterium]MCW5871062.1 hypothetical protein [Candidatus Eremiobacteraeota bacterium]